MFCMKKKVVTKLASEEVIDLDWEEDLPLVGEDGEELPSINVE